MAAETIGTADMVVIAPGDLYTSIGPTLVLRGMGEALRSARAVMMVSNLMNPPRHTRNYTTSDYVREYTRLAGGERFIDRIIYNTQQLDTQALEEQMSKGSHQVITDADRLIDEGYVAHGYDLISSGKPVFDKSDRLAMQGLRSEIRHDPNKVFSALLHVYMNSGFADPIREA